MKYLSTRAEGERTDALRPFCEVLLEGLAPDGGLYLPQTYPQVDDATLTRWRLLSYADLAFEILCDVHRRHPVRPTCAHWCSAPTLPRSSAARRSRR